SGNAEGVMAVGSVDVSFRGDVLERAVAAIVVENILRSGESAGAAHHGHSLPHAGRTLTGSGRGREVEVDVVGDHEIEVAVAVVVNPGAPRAPRLAGPSYTGLLRNLGEDAVLIMK